jgi:SagB-type dehydrogenase family enzyme
MDPGWQSGPPKASTKLTDNTRKSMYQSLKWLCFAVGLMLATAGWGQSEENDVIRLPNPVYDGKVSVERAIKQRRTIRGFLPKALSLAQLSQLLWSAQGITDDSHGYRSAPSAGALYPLDVYTIVGSVRELETGVYRYNPESHSLKLISGGDSRHDVATASLSQMWIAEAPVVFVVTSEYERITWKYRDRGIRYAHIEVGHVGQNIFLQAEALGLGAGIVGAFHDDEVTKAIGAPEVQKPLIVMPVGYKR